MIETTYIYPNAPYIALIGDFHNGNPDPVIDSLNANRPELIAIAGDVIFQYTVHRRKSVLQKQRRVLTFLSACAEIAPTYFSLGNHERILDKEDLASIRTTGITILDNNWVKHGDYCIGGLTSGYVEQYRRYKKNRKEKSKRRLRLRYPVKGAPRGTIGHLENQMPDFSWLEEFSEQPDYKILLCHHPEYISFLPANIDLVLSGHAHGGQIRLFQRGIYAPGQGWWPEYTKGQYDNMIVTAGLNNTAKNIPRINNPTEIVYINPRKEIFTT